MLFPDSDAPLVKDWIVKRLENTSDADADVLADYVLALLHNESDDADIQKVFETEITAFLKEDTKLFANDLIQAIKYKSYVPGAPPPPKSQPSASLQSTTPGLGAFVTQQNLFPTGPAAGSRKRGFQDRGDFDAPNGRDQPQGGRPLKQPRRGRGGRNGYLDLDRPQPTPQIQYGHSNAPAHPNAPPFVPSGTAAPMPTYDPNNPLDPMEAMRQLQHLSQQIGLQMGAFPDLLQQPGFQPQRKKKGRCRDYDTKGYCARGPNCIFQHDNGNDQMFNLPAPQTSGQLQLPTEGRSILPFQSTPNGNGAFSPQFDSLIAPDFNFLDSSTSIFGAPDLTQQSEYGPNTATMIAPQHLTQQQRSNGYINNRRDNRQGPNRKGPPRAPFSAAGPIHDRTQTKVVVENIPEENFDEEQVRGFFMQFGNIEEVSMQPYKRLAIVKYDNWGSANAAYRSPKVIFDNRFVRVYWFKDEKHADLANGGASAQGIKSDFSDENGLGGSSAEVKVEEEIDKEEFARKQEEAQKAHEEKMRKKGEIEKQRAELEKRQKELQAKHEAEKQRLLAKIGGSKKESGGSGSAATVTENTGKDGTKSSAQTEALKATLAKLQEEAKSFGLDPNAQSEDDAMISTYSGYYPRGGRGGYYRGRGGFTPRGSFRGRGGRGNIHAAYAAFSLDNRPKKVAISGVDFSAPEKDEALRQHLFSLGEFTAEIQVTPSTTHISFNDRKAAEKFYNSITNKHLPGLEGDEIELSWVSNTAAPLQDSSTTKVDFTSNGGTAEDGLDSLMADGSGGNQNGTGQHEAGGDVDYDVAGENEWDIH